MPADLPSGARPAPHLELPAVLDLKAAAPLATTLLAKRGAELLVDASRVQRLGGQCLQVLLSASLTWKADEVPFGVVDASAEFLDALALLGIPAGDLVEQDLDR